MISVAVLRGGPSNEHEVSLKSGAQVLSSLALSNLYRPVDVFIDRTGTWYVRGVAMEPERALCSVDVVFNALHGSYGEDGVLQRMLDRLQVPYTGSGAYASGLAMNKLTAKDFLQKAGVRTPMHKVLNVSADLESEMVEVYKSFSPPCVIKPTTSGSSVGVTLAKTFEQFKEGVKNAFQHSRQVLVEEYVKGKEATIGIVERLRGKDAYVLPAVEIIPAVSFFDYDAKYSGGTEERCPGNFSQKEVDELGNMALAAHSALGLRHYSRSDFIVTPKGAFYLETNTLPGLTAESLLPKSLASVGVTLPEFIEHTLTLAYEK